MIISSVASFFPKRCVFNSEIVSTCSSNVSFIRNKLGIEKRFFLDDDMSELNISVGACNKLLENNKNIDFKKVDLFVYVGQAKRRIIPHTSAQLQGILGIPYSSFVFDLSLACSGYIYALEIIESLSVKHSFRNALLVTCDPYSIVLNKNDKNTYPLFGDCATASFLTDNGSGLQIGNVVYGTNGKYADFLHCNVHDKLYMNGRGIFNFVMRYIPNSIKKCMELNSLTDKDIKYYFVHQANRFIVEALASRMQVDFEKFPIVLEDSANTVSSSIPYIIEKYIDKINIGENCILSAFGGGISWASISVKMIGGINE